MAADGVYWGVVDDVVIVPTGTGDVVAETEIDVATTINLAEAVSPALSVTESVYVPDVKGTPEVVTSVSVCAA